MEEIVYQFATEERGICAGKALEVRTAIRTWQANYPRSSLTMRTAADDGSLVVADRRAGWPQREIRLAPGMESSAYLTLRRPRTVEAAAAGLGVPAAEFGRLVDDWVRQGLVFCDGGRVIAIATSRASIKIEEH